MSATGRKLGSQVIPAVPALGMRRYGLQRIYVGLTPDQFERVRAMAVQNGIGVSEQTRNVIEWGLETVGDYDDGDDA